MDLELVTQSLPPRKRGISHVASADKTVEVMLGSQEALDAVGQVDCLIIYDILLHQVAPDWDQLSEVASAYENGSDLQLELDQDREYDLIRGSRLAVAQEQRPLRG